MAIRKSIGTKLSELFRRENHRWIPRHVQREPDRRISLSIGLLNLGPLDRNSRGRLEIESKGIDLRPGTDCLIRPRVATDSELNWLDRYALKTDINGR